MPRPVERFCEGSTCNQLHISIKFGLLVLSRYCPTLKLVNGSEILVLVVSEPLGISVTLKVLVLEEDAAVVELILQDQDALSTQIPLCLSSILFKRAHCDKIIL